MDNPDLKSQLEAIVPGVVDAYASLKSYDGMGLHTSSGRFYNHTLFGRDGSMTAKFVSDFDHAVTQETILALAALQGTEYNARTQEEPGRIHHELRDFRTWKGSLFERFGFWMLRGVWDVEDKQLLTYFSQDTTASYIRLVHKYATRIDGSILERTVTNHHGDKVTIAETIEKAATWLVEKLDDRGLFLEQRKNKWSLPFQTFQDSVYARADGTVADYRHAIGYVEVQAYVADALHDVARLLPEHDSTEHWQESAERMQKALLKHYWNEEDQYFASALDSKGQIDIRNISAGWIFNSTLWTNMSAKDQEKYIAPVIERLFSHEFLTNVGLRSRSIEQASPMPDVVAYHDRETVWPMFSFMVIEGLRRHRLYALAEQLENRLVNAINASGKFDEFYIVSENGDLYLDTAEGNRPVNVQMMPEKYIAFTVVPAMVIAKRASYKGEHLKQLTWQKALEKKVLESIDTVERAQPDEAHQYIGTIVGVKNRRWLAGIKTIQYFRRQGKA